ncbi:hypothetical protein I540_3308 [Mycobacteroides abscessus subsp. bolletii 1513]|uniref:Uncharacterized protein n=1 Tax=Mycobacteroides abscessus subsp. bolletii 1513 TaxID=1299321 RepID=X8DRX5_9MYCO|nr:hypothetical protein I540_3308 [Mycobacteroides abscessus subsp. bolletii 1513]
MAPFAPPGDPSGSSKLSAMAHALVYVLGIAILLRVALWFGYLEGANEIMTWVLMIVFGASVWHQLRPGLCLRCMKEVPLDGPVRAETQRSLLKLAHFNGSWKSVTVTVALVIVGPIIVDLLLNDEHTSLSSVPSDLWIFALIYSNWLHHRLRPWCPYCRDWDDDGDPEPSRIRLRSARRPFTDQSGAGFALRIFRGRPPPAPRPGRRSNAAFTACLSKSGLLPIRSAGAGRSHGRGIPARRRCAACPFMVRTVDSASACSAAISATDTSSRPSRYTGICPPIADHQT